MSTTSKGNHLEDKIFALFQSEISEDRFFAKAENCKVYRKKGYYSKDRDKKIVFDVSIEIFLPGCEDYSVLVLIECKNYTHPVPVDDAEEFFAKTQQVGAAKVKGIIAATSCFQEGTLTYSRSKGMGLLRYFDDSNFKWSLARSSALGELHETTLVEPREVVRGLLSSEYQSAHHHFFCRGARETGASLPDLLTDCVRSVDVDDSALQNVLQRVQPAKPTVKFLSRGEVDERAKSVHRWLGHTHGPVPLDALCQRVAARTGLVLKKEPQDVSRGWSPGVLARIQFSPLEITLYEDPNWNFVRQRFTLAHELGHLLVGHSEYISGEYCEEADFAMERALELGHTDVRRIEWQANYFASCLLLPQDAVIADVSEAAHSLGLQDRGHGLLFVDDQPCNQENYYRITGGLCSKYQVSRTALKIRLMDFGLLNDVREGRLTHN